MDTTQLIHARQVIAQVQERVLERKDENSHANQRERKRGRRGGNFKKGGYSEERKKKAN